MNHLRIHGERGMAMIIALLALTLLSMLGLVLMMSLNTESRLTSQNVTSASALNVAEAGIAEATSRISSGEISFGVNPRGTALIFNQVSGSLPAVGTDTTALATAQPAGAWLAYTTANKNSQVLSVAYKTDAGRTVIYKYDTTKNPAVQTVSGMPIYVITSTGRSGNSVRRVVAEVTQQAVAVNMYGAVVCNKGVGWSGNDYMCGYNHQSSTPTGKGSAGRAGGNSCVPYETGSMNLTGLWSGGAIGSPGSYAAGTPNTLATQPGFYAGPWEPLNTTQAAFWTWVGPRQSSAPAVPVGIVHLDNNGTAQDQSGAFSFNGGDGEGFLYVDGDLTLNGNFHFRGLIYVEGNLSINSWTWILGGVIIRGKVNHDWHSNGTILYSKDAITEELAKYSGNFITLSWREI